MLRGFKDTESKLLMTGWTHVVLKAVNSLPLSFKLKLISMRYITDCFEVFFESSMWIPKLLVQRAGLFIMKWTELCLHYTTLMMVNYQFYINNVQYFHYNNTCVTQGLLFMYILMWTELGNWGKVLGLWAIWGETALNLKVEDNRLRM